MPNGPTNGGGGHSGGYDPISGGYTTMEQFSGGGGGTEALKKTKPALEKRKSVSYSASQSDQIFSISTDTSATSAGGIPKLIEVTNNGSTPIYVLTGYETYSGDATDAGVEYLHTILMPNDSFIPPIRGIIATGADTVIVDGTVVNNAAPDSNEYTDSTADVDSATANGIVSSSSSTLLYLEPYTSAANCTANLFRVNDLIRVRDEVMKVTAIGDKSDLANNTLTVERGMYGSTAVTAAADDDPVRLPFFNAYHDFDKYSVAQTDSNGKFNCFNMFGLGRAATGSQGITPGSFSIKFYEPGYQSLGLSGITSSTNSGLTASTAYKIDITVDGGTLFQDLTFTTDSSNVNFGGTSGIISKIQAALDVQYYTAGNLFEKKVTCAIVDGDVRFSSGSYLSTSAILLADTTDSGSFIDANANGRIPAAANIPSAVAARLPDDSIFDLVTAAASPNLNVFGQDDGAGNIIGACHGTISYDSGSLDLINCLPNAEFVFSCMHTSAFSGKLTEGTADRENVIKDIFVNTPSQKELGSVVLRTW